MRNVWLIARREYLEQIRGKAFRITTIMVPLVFVGLFALIFLAGKNSGTGKHLVIASNDAALAEGIREQLVSEKEARTIVEVVAPAAPGDRDRLRQRVTAKQVDGVLWLETGAEDMQPKATYESLASGDFATVARLAGAVSRVVMQQKLARRGMTAEEIGALTGHVNIETETVKNGKASRSSAARTFVTAYAMTLLLSFTVVMYGLNVGRSVIQEKTSRIFEVMLASVQAEEMLAGKLIGVGAVGLTQIAIWGFAAAAFGGSALAATSMPGKLGIHISGVEVALFCIYFLLGYILYSALFAGLAATVSTEQELQQYSPLAAVPIWLSFGMMAFIISNPNSIWSVVISMFPPCAPITMFLRIESEFPPVWQIALSIGLMVAAILVLLWLATRIYRVGILMYGKRANLPEMLRWLRYS